MNLPRFQIGDEEHDDHFCVVDEEAPFVRADDYKDEDPKKTAQKY